MNRALINYITELLNPYSTYYSDGVLNSEGMTILRVIAREVLKEYPWLRRRFAKARRRRDYEYVSSLMSEVLQLITSGSSSPS
ncbi:hypothetical protein [Vulcanisaeta thermophila]|uniref:hypothetical protein n=1 Tax=Vulcanisaeta thermophila TaxID=867917 RepID=UPI000852A13E|nr:hypothetical protein [Vulcanisaeta thermophila]